VGRCSEYHELPDIFKNYCAFIEKYLGTKIAYISNGVEREQLLVIN